MKSLVDEREAPFGGAGGPNHSTGLAESFYWFGVTGEPLLGYVKPFLQKEVPD